MAITDRRDSVQQVGPASSADPLVTALQSLYRAYQMTTMYPSGHPTIPEALSGAAHSFSQALGAHPRIVVRVTRDRLLLDEVVLNEASDALISLAGFLHEIDVAALEFNRGLTSDDLTGLVAVLSSARRLDLRGGSLVAALGEAEVEHLELRPIDYGSLRFGAGVRGQESDPVTRDVWDSLTRSLLDDPPTDTAHFESSEIAETVTHQIVHQEGAGIGTLRSSLNKLARQLHELTPGHRQRVRSKMARFVEALNPELRKDLLRVDPRLPDETLALIGELIDDFGEIDLLDALKSIDEVGGRLSDQLLMLLNKLVRISGKQPNIATDLSSIMARWGVSPDGLETDPASLRSALEEVFQRRAPVTCTPEPYQFLLDNLSRHQLSGDYPPSSKLYRDPRDREVVGIQTAEIAVMLLAQPEGDAHRAGIFGYLGGNADVLIDRGAFDVLRETAVMAREAILLNADSKNTQRAARGYLNEFNDPNRIDRILGRACRDDTVPAAAIDLLRLGGTDALHGVLGVLASGPVPEVREALRRFAGTFGPGEVQEVLNSYHDADWSALQPTFDVIRELPAVSAIPLLEQLYSHADGRVRRQALIDLCELDRGPAKSEHHLRVALCDPSISVSSVAIQRLSRLQSLQSTKLLGAYLENRLEGVDSNPNLCIRAARSLIDRGERGRARLTQAMNRLCWSLSLRNARIVGSTRATLEAHRGYPEIDRCLKRINLSPAGLLGLFLPSLAAEDSE